MGSHISTVPKHIKEDLFQDILNISPKVQNVQEYLESEEQRHKEIEKKTNEEKK